MYPPAMRAPASGTTLMWSRSASGMCPRAPGRVGRAEQRHRADPVEVEAPQHAEGEVYLDAVAAPRRDQNQARGVRSSAGWNISTLHAAGIMVAAGQEL